tara:strand:+ start:3843 stop:3986 length:144 start_codon:yes stop_codon:yes gene_type:complete
MTTHSIDNPSTMMNNIPAYTYKGGLYVFSPISALGAGNQRTVEKSNV